jgi:hypothetical protein
VSAKFTAFEERVLEKLISIEHRITKLEGKAMLWGALAGALLSVLTHTAYEIIKFKLVRGNL